MDCFSVVAAFVNVNNVNNVKTATFVNLNTGNHVDTLQQNVNNGQKLQKFQNGD